MYLHWRISITLVKGRNPIGINYTLYSLIQHLFGPGYKLLNFKCIKQTNGWILLNDNWYA